MTPDDVFWSRCEGPIVYGVNDCCTTVADVIVAAGGPDLMAAYRGRYKTQFGYMRAIRKAGHITLVEALSADLAKYERVETPRDFDLGIVSYLDDGGRRAAPAFFRGGFWGLRSERGAMFTVSNHDSIFRVI